MQPAKQPINFVVLNIPELVSDQLLSEIHGEVLLIRSKHSTTICKRSARNMRQRALSWLSKAGTARDISFIAGNISDNGGRFQIINRNQAVELLGMWVFKKI